MTEAQTLLELLMRELRNSVNNPDDSVETTDALFAAARCIEDVLLRVKAQEQYVASKARNA